MKRRNRWVALLALSIMAGLLLLVACSESGTPTLPPSASPTPTVSPFQPLSEVERNSINRFAIQTQDINARWEKFHLDFDTWRQSLTACEPNALRGDLHQFAAQFSSIVRTIRSLPREVEVDFITDVLLSAAEEESRTLRELRDNWVPGANELFEAVAKQQAVSAGIHNEVKDLLRALGRLTTEPEERGNLTNFVSAFEELQDAWGEFNQNYEQFRSQRSAMTPQEESTRLSELVAQFGDIVDEVVGLPSLKLTEPVAKTLLESAQRGDLALRRVRNALDEATEASFQEFDAHLVESAIQRRSAAEGLDRIVKLSLEDNRGAVDKFRQSAEELLNSWSGFHSDFSEWRRDDGGCNRSKVVAALSQFIVDFSQIASDVRSLPKLQVLEPLGEKLVSSVEREQRALGSLRSGWMPFDPTVYDEFDQKRAEANQLRRQVLAGLNQVLTQVDLSLGSIGSD